jgi:hypothetical protein
LTFSANRVKSKVMSGKPIKKRAALLFVIFALAMLPVVAQKGKNAEIKRIESYVKTLDRFVKNKKPQLVFADTSDYNDDGKAKWQKFASEKALEKFREERSETYAIAYNWLQKGRLVKSNFTLFSPSGDWAQYVFHNFRADGTLAHVQSEMRTFNGDLIITQDLFFNPRGQLLKKSIRYADLQTRKPIKPTKEFLENQGNFSNDVEYYKKVGKLPFAGLLRKASR